MTDKGFLQVDFTDLNNYIQEHKDREETFIRVARREYTDLSMLFETATRKLAPMYDGELARSISFDMPVWKGSVFQFAGGAGAAHALKQHEMPERKGKHDAYVDGVKHEGWYEDGRGKRTRQKPSYKGFLPGRKYLENALLAEEESIVAAEKRILDALGGNKR